MKPKVTDTRATILGGLLSSGDILRNSHVAALAFGRLGASPVGHEVICQ
jgi:hypothetical protein